MGREEAVMAEFIAHEKLGRFGGYAEVIGYRVNIPKEEIIRCIDCRFFNSECKCTNPRWYYDNGAIMHCPKVEADGFCSWSERRWNGDDK